MVTKSNFLRQQVFALLRESTTSEAAPKNRTGV